MRNVITLLSCACCLSLALAAHASGTIAEKLSATYAAVTNIAAAIEEKGVSTRGRSLVDYADLIRRLVVDPLPPIDPEYGYRIKGDGFIADVYTNAVATDMTWAVPDSVDAFEFLVVGGGGAGYYGGGGAGGMVTGLVENVSGKTFAIKVGPGGEIGVNNDVLGASSFGADGVTYVSAPGGGRASGSSGGAGKDGGSGGGGNKNGGQGGTVVAPTINTSLVSHWVAFGNVGAKADVYGSGGGGGAGHAGYTTAQSDVVNDDSYGGEGVWSSITGESVCYAGGGNGGGNRRSGEPLSPKPGGGGRGGINMDGFRNAEPGEDGLGAGGGGVYQGAAARGGSGVVIVRYRMP